MSQFARPSEDTYRDNWETHLGGTTNLWQQIDEVTFDDNDFIQTQLTPTQDVYVSKLSPIQDPLVSTGHSFDYRYGKNASGGDQIDQTVQVRQNYVNEGSPGTLIFEDVLTNVGPHPQQGSHALTGPETDAINTASYNGELYMRVIGNKP